MFKLDKNAFTAGNIFRQSNEVSKYKGLSLEELFAVFAYLNSTAYNYDLNNPPKMDKSVLVSGKCKTRVIFLIPIFKNLLMRLTLIR